MKLSSAFLLLVPLVTTSIVTCTSAQKNEMILSQQLKSKPKTDRIGNIYERYEQTINGIPVYGTEKIVSTLANGTTRSKDNFWTNINQNLSDTVPRITAEEAKSIAIDYVEKSSNQKAETKPMNEDDDNEMQLFLVRIEKKDYLVYRVQLYQVGHNSMSLVPPSPIDGSSLGGGYAMPLLFIDAHSGQVLDWFDNLKMANSS